MPNRLSKFSNIAGQWRGSGRWCSCSARASCTAPGSRCPSVPSAWRNSSNGARGSPVWYWAASSGATASPKCSEATWVTGKKRRERLWLSHGTLARILDSPCVHTDVCSSFESRRLICRRSELWARSEDPALVFEPSTGLRNGNKPGVLSVWWCSYFASWAHSVPKIFICVWRVKFTTGS